MSGTVPPPARDVGFLAMQGLLLATAVWLLCTPISPAVASVTLRRFHLGSRSFGSWAIQFPIPAMYNFANRYEVRETAAKRDDANAGLLVRRYANHFPTRLITFADSRHLYLSSHRDRWFTIRSCYQGQCLTSRFHARPKRGGGFQILRLAPQQSARERQ
jgi:hypothetical protein